MTADPPLRRLRTLRLVGRRLLLVVAVACLLVVAWATISGGLRQLDRARTLGQRVETGVQLACGLLSLLTVLTAFVRRRWGPGVGAAWSIALATAAGLSSLVWGPPSVSVGLVFAALTLLLALGIVRLLRIGVGAWSGLVAATPAGPRA